MGKLFDGANVKLIRKVCGALGCELPQIGSELLLKDRSTV